MRPHAHVHLKGADLLILAQPPRPHRLARDWELHFRNHLPLQFGPGLCQAAACNISGRVRKRCWRSCRGCSCCLGCCGRCWRWSSGGSVRANSRIGCEVAKQLRRGVGAVGDGEEVKVTLEGKVFEFQVNRASASRSNCPPTVRGVGQIPCAVGDHSPAVSHQHPITLACTGCFAALEDLRCGVQDPDQPTGTVHRDPGSVAQRSREVRPGDSGKKRGASWIDALLERNCIMPLRLHDLEVDTRRHDPAARGGGGHELSHLARHRHVHAAACRDVPWGIVHRVEASLHDKCIRC
mmetsp:Transcript_60667/g.142868  ORF Transcript_60667/g.142868 Transcript_60667/m.142868 type:complete len:294 (+) Transcript_60667:1202-2083(+)